jgi:hypothetical protein
MNRSHWQSIACALAACLAATPAAAQRATLSGQVVDAAGGQPVAAAVVEVMPRRDRAVTDAQGRFTVRTTLGEHVIVASALGYGSAITPVAIGDAEVDVQVALDRDPVLLEGIVATVNRLESRRRSYPFTVRSLNVAQIATSGATDMERLVRERFGVYFTSCRPSSSTSSMAPNNLFRGAPAANCVYSRGGAIPSRVYVDEVRMPDAGILATFTPQEVASVEVFHNGEQIRVYTRGFMEWAARRDYAPLPLSLASF